MSKSLDFMTDDGEIEQDNGTSAFRAVGDNSAEPPASPDSAAPIQLAVPARVLRERVSRMDATLDPESPTFGAALLLLAGLQLEHNVVKLARFTRLQPEFVSRCARRLIDNGVWRAGHTLAEWCGDEFDERAFWADVAVAEGKLCRRLDDQARPQWAPGGHWWKSFDLSSPGAGEQSVLYHSPPPALPATDPLLPYPDDEDEADAAAECEVGFGMEALIGDELDAPDEVRQDPPDAEPEENDDEQGSDSPAPTSAETTERLRRDHPELFPDAIWL